MIYIFSLQVMIPVLCHVLQVYKQLLDHQLSAKAAKFEFQKPPVSFQGYVISKSKLQIDLAQIKAILDWPMPINRKEVQIFLGIWKLLSKVYQKLNAVTTSPHALNILQELVFLVLSGWSVACFGRSFDFLPLRWLGSCTPFMIRHAVIG